MSNRNTYFGLKIITVTAWLFSGIACGPSLATADLIDFEDLTLAENSYFDGYGENATSGTWQSGGASFNTNQFGPGWSYSNVNDTTTPGFENQWAAITGSGVGGNGIYALANSFEANGAVINFPGLAALSNVQVTNSTYAALAMLHGDSFSKKFGGETGDDPDFFRVTFSGFSGFDASGTKTGNADLFLADYRFDDNSLDYIVDQWTNVDLSALGNARSIGVAFDGSDVGPFGLNTPAYVAIDHLQFTSVPEPGATLILATLLLVSARRFRSI